MPPLPGFVLRDVEAGQRHLATIPTSAAAEAVAWVEGLKRARMVEEYRLGPATLEDVYVELVGRIDALENGNGSAHASTPVREHKEAIGAGAA